MVLVTVKRHSQITIPKEIRESVGITEGDKVKIRVVEGTKIIIEKADNKEIWKDCTNFLPKNYEKITNSTRSDATSRFKRLGLIP